ncbi:hypothetical protein N9137_02225 [Pseudomonadales bacterium]|nr:hypothetical protein [Pseudomonadales bacterium]
MFYKAPDGWKVKQVYMSNISGVVVVKDGIDLNVPHKGKAVLAVAYDAGDSKERKFKTIEEAKDFLCGYVTKQERYDNREW